MEDKAGLGIKEQPENDNEKAPEYDHNAAGGELFSELFDAMLRDVNAAKAFNEAEAEFMKGQNPMLLGRDLRYEFTTDKGIKLKARVYRAGVAVYGSTLVEFEELESARPYKTSIAQNEGDFRDTVDFSVGNLRNSPQAEAGFREALSHFFGTGINSTN